MIYFQITNEKTVCKKYKITLGIQKDRINEFYLHKEYKS